MYKTELELEKRLNDIALANVPSTSYENIVVVPRMRHHTPLEMSPDEFDLRDLMLEQKMNVISINAIVDKLGWKPSKIKSDVTKEMIADYQLEQMANLKEGLYVPAALDLDLVELPEEIVTFTEKEIQDRRTALRAMAEDIRNGEGALGAIAERRLAQQDDLNLRLGQEITRLDESGMNAIQRAKAKRDTRRQADNSFKGIELEYQRDEEAIKTRIADITAQYTAIQAELDGNARDVSEYQRQVSDAQAENARRRRIYEDTVRSVNTGRNFIAMLPDETADEYKERLKQIGDSTANTDAVQSAAGLLYSDRLREKMSEITRDDTLIGTFIAGLSIDQRYSLVKIWETFKKKVLEIFGVNNKFMSVDDLSNIAGEMADIVAARAIAEPVVFKEVDERDVLPIRAFAVEEGSEIPALGGARAEAPSSKKKPKEPLPPFVLSANGEKLTETRKQEILRYANQGGTVPSFPNKLTQKNELIYQEELARAVTHKEKREARERAIARERLSGSVEEAASPVDFTPFEEAPAEPDFSLAELQLAIQAMASDLADEDAKDRLLGVMTDPTTGNPRTKESLIKVLKTSGFYKDVIARIPTRGSGMKGMSIKYPKIVPFGLIEVSPHKLFYENILKITRKGKRLTGFPNVKVSNDFVSFLFKILDGGQPTLRDVNKLSVGEKQLFDSVVFTAGLQKKVEDTGSGVKQKFKDRLALIEGEIEAGNTSDELIKEARQILQHLARMKVIGHRAAAGHLKQLISVQRG